MDGIRKPKKSNYVLLTLVFGCMIAISLFTLNFTSYNAESLETRSATVTLHVTYNGNPVGGVAVYYDGFESYNQKFTFDGFTNNNGYYFLIHGTSVNSGSIYVIKNWPELD